MTVNFVPNAARERELLAHLGLGPGASDDEIEAAHDDIVTFLDAAPSALRGWARGRLSDADQTYAILRGGLVDPTPAPRPAAAPQVATRPAAPQPARAAAQRPSKAGSNGRLADDEADLLDEQDGHPSSAGRKASPVRRQRVVHDGRGVTVRRNDVHQPTSFLARPMRRAALIGGLVVAVGAIAFGIYALGAPAVPGITGSPVPGASSPAIDAAAVSELMQKLTTNPKDLEALQGLANLYYAAGDFETASTWLAKVLEIDPKNVAALLGSGAASYNLGNYPSAESAWRQVLAIDEKNVEAHYDLGWMYLSEDPPDVEKVKAEWTRVIALDPTSEAAKTAASHLQRLDPSFSPAPASPAPTGAPAATTSPS